ncbi:unannotated protein [freshwater metagenome]|uniref:Unannotated protein n=1 Tax=freshwater metagenome TaxID=449393 RepID=A0A6J7NBM9_9ZZZZ
MLLHENALEVIDLVLEDSRGKIVELEIEFVTIEVVALHMDLGGANDVEM